MRAIIIQHASFEGPGYILKWLHKHNFATDIWLIYDPTHHVPNPLDTDLLILMGGPMSVNDDKRYPWLKREKELVQQAMELNIPILGICFGGQLIANVCGKNVTPAPYKEIGWFPITSSKQENNNLFQFPEQFTSFLWHGEQFETPNAGTLLASSEACHHQAFQLHDNIIGLQFHPEVTSFSIQDLIKNGQQELVNNAPYIQTAKALTSAPPEYFLQNHQIIDNLLSFLMKEPRND